MHKLTCAEISCTGITFYLLAVFIIRRSPIVGDVPCKSSPSYSLHSSHRTNGETRSLNKVQFAAVGWFFLHFHWQDS